MLDVRRLHVPRTRAEEIALKPMAPVVQRLLTIVLLVLPLTSLHPLANTQVVWQDEPSGTVAVPSRGGKEVTITSQKYGYTLTMPYWSNSWEAHWAWDTPLRVRTDRFVVTMKIAPRGGESALEYLRTSLKELENDQDLLIESPSFLTEAAPPILRYMVKMNVVPDVIKDPNYWRWNYLAAVPGVDSWYLLHISTHEKAKPGRQPRYTEALDIIRDGFVVNQKNGASN